MSIYTITLKRELLSGSDTAATKNNVGQLDSNSNNNNNKQSNWKIGEEGKEREKDSSERLIAFQEASARGESRESHNIIDGGEKRVYGYNRREEVEEAYRATRDKIEGDEQIDRLLDCVCSKKVFKVGGDDDDDGDQEKEGSFEESDKENRLQEEGGGGVQRQEEQNLRKSSRGHVGHSSECLKFREKQRELLLERERVLQEQANQIEHSVNVTLEVTANLKQPNRIVWYKNNKQLTSSEKPVLLVSRDSGPIRRYKCAAVDERLSAAALAGANKKVIKATKTTTTTTTTTSTTKRSSTSAQGEGELIEEKEDQAEEVTEREEEEEGVLANDFVAKCEQESNEKGSKLKIYNIQDEDYGQYTCKLIDLIDGRQFDIHAQLKEDLSSKVENNSSSSKRVKGYALRFQTNAMDEVIEVKEGDLNIELGIQILPETDEDEELMSEEEKAEFIENTTINWFKDDVKLNKEDPEVKKLFQFTYDQEAGFHRLIVRKATKETEGVYTCLVENESGTSSCSTQLVVGPGNKPKLTSRLQDVTVYVGQSLEFRIKSTGLPPIDSCQWFKDDKLIIEMKNEETTGETIKSSSNERISMSRDVEQKQSSFVKEEEEKIIIFKLCIDNLKLDDTGRYKCRINNEYGYDETDCMVKVLQEIIEEHEEIEETIEETTRLGGGKKSTREEEEILEEEEQQVVDEEEETRKQSIKRVRQERDEDMLDGDGQAPRFRRKLSKQIFVNEEQIDEEELIVSTEIDKWSESSSSLKIRWFINDVEIIKNTQRDLYEIENFYDRESSQWMHKLILRSIKKLASDTKSSRNKFTCRASNQFGEDETSCFVEAQKKPRFLRTLEDIETSVGETRVLKVAVDVETSTVDDVIFIKDGKVIYSSESNGEEAQSIDSSGSKSKLKIKSYERTIEEEEIEETTSRYSSRYSSRRSSRTIGRRGKVFELTIENVQIDQQGTWECIAKNRAGTSSCKADVEVFDEPKIVTDLPEKVRVEPGKEIRLTVEASGSPIPVYSWFKDGTGIAEVEDRVFTETKQTTTTTKTTTTKRRSSITSLRTEDGINISGETLIIKDARPEDAGVYKCKIENRLGQVISRDCEMTVVGHGDDQSSAPRIIKDFSRDQLFEVDEGENVTLKVLAEGHPKPKQYWFKDTEEIIERVTKYEIENEGQEYELKIKRSEQLDSGNYKVILRNEFGETESRTVMIKVNKISDESDIIQRRPSAPTIMLDSQDKVVGLGSNVSFDVQVGGHPKPFITWYKNGRRLTESGDERICFVEEETTTTTIVEEEEEISGKKSQKSRKDVSTIHKLIIKDVRESDEAIYSLKAENDLGSTKSSLVSLTVDKRKEITDELIESEEARRAKSRSKEAAVVEETTTTTTTTVTRTTEEQEEEEDQREEGEFSRRSRKSSGTRTIEEDLDDDAGDGTGRGCKKTTKTRTTRTTTTTTTTTEEEEAEAEEARRRKRAESQTESETDSTRKSKRRTVVEEEEEEEEEEAEEEEEEAKKVRRWTRTDEEREDVEEDTIKKKRDKVVEMEVDEEEEIREEISKTKKRDSISEKEKKKTVETTTSKREKGKLIEEILEQTETSETTTVERSGPRLVSAPKEVVAGLGSSPELEVEIEETKSVRRDEEEEETKITWLKDDQPIPARLLKDNHIEIIEKVGSKPNTKKHILRINSLRSSDAASYKLKAENPKGHVETEPIEVQIDRTMRPGEKALVTPAEIKPQAAPSAPEIISVPEEIVAGVGSSPEIVAVLKGEPKPETTWFKDGQPITAEELESGHLEIVKKPTDEPRVTEEALKINDLRPADVAAYHVKAENPLGDVESEPTNVRIDRSMGPRDEPVVTAGEAPMEVDELVPAKKLLELPSQPQTVKAPLGSSPDIEIPVKGGKPDNVQWLKDGKPISEKPGEIRFDAAPDGTQKLHVDNLKPSDAGVYTLKATNDAGTAESAPVRLVPEDAGPQFAPQVVRATEEVVAGPGSQPELQVVIRANPEAAVTWFKDGAPLTERQLADGHLEPVEEKQDEPNVIAYTLKIDKLRAADSATYHVVAKNPLGTAECKPIKLKLDRTMRPSETPQVKLVEQQAPDDASTLGDRIAPEVLSMPEEIVAPVGSSPKIEAEIKAAPKADVQWFKDGQPISARELRDGHLEMTAESTGIPDVTKHSLKINDIKPIDVAAYHLKAENPLGDVDSEPVNVRIDRSMRPNEEPIVTQNKSLLSETPTDIAKSGSTDEKPQVDLAGQLAPKLVAAAREVVAGLGSSPKLEVEVAAKPEAAVQWLKDGQPIPARLLRDGHVELSEESTPIDGVKKQTLKINEARPSDAAEYSLKAENPIGEAESEPIKLKLDRSMSFRDEPKVKPSPRASLSAPSGDQTAPSIVSMPEEIVAGVGSSPSMEVEVAAKPEAVVQWFKDGQPILARELRDGHVEIKAQSAPLPGVTKHVLKINDLKPVDVAAYHLKAENPLGEVESEPINVRIDRSMGPSDEPLVTQNKSIPDIATANNIAKSESLRETPEANIADQLAPKLVAAAQEVVAGLGSTPTLEVEVAAKPEAAVQWLKDGQPIPARLLRDGHVELSEDSTPVDGVKKHSLKINEARPSDAAEYSIKAKNPLGEAESEPIKLKLDRSMSSSDAPKIKPARKESIGDLGQAKAPSIVSIPKEVVAGLGSTPTLEVEVSGKPEAAVKWLKDGQPIPERLLRDGHVELLEESSPIDGAKKHVLKINEARPSDAADYSIRAENPIGEVESEPIKLKLDRSMSSSDEPKVMPSQKEMTSKLDGDERAPSIVSVPEEIVSGPGSSPAIVAEVEGNPSPEITWFKDGQPIDQGQLRSGHLEVVDIPTDKPDVKKQALKINDLRPADVAAYHVKAENPLGDVESEPTNVRIDRSMGPRDEPVVTAGEAPMEVDELVPAKKLLELPSQPQTVKAPLGSSPDIEIPVKGGKPDNVQWLKDGKPISEKPGEIRFDAAPDGTQKLHVDNLKPSDAGVYTLKATNDAGTAESAPVRLVPEDAGPQFAPQVVRATEEVVAGPGSQPELQVVIRANPEAAVTWFKDGAPLTERQLADGHLEPVEEKQDEPNVIAYTLKIDKLRAADSATYHVVAKNPLGTAECKPIKLKLDRTMRPSETPQVKLVEQQAPDDASTLGDRIAPEVLSMPEEIVAPVGSSPKIEAEIKAAPKADVQWFKDGQPISARELRDGHLEMTAESTGIPDVTKHSLKINDIKPIDVAAYHLKAENPLGDVDSEPVNVRIDRSMRPNEEPIVTPNESLPGSESPIGAVGDLARSAKTPEADMAEMLAPKLVSTAQEIVAALGSSPKLEVEVAAKPEASVQWLKDGQPIPARLLRDGHIELSEASTPVDGVKRQTLKVNEARPSDAAEYSLKAENPIGEAESEPIKLKLDRSMSPGDEPRVKASPRQSLSAPSGGDQSAPSIVSVPEEIVSGPGSSPAIVAEVEGNPSPEITWFKDGQPIDQGQLRSGHLEVVDIPTDKPDVKKQALKINDLRPADVAAYHVKAENPLGDVESEPTNVRIDRSMGPRDEPVVSKPDEDEQESAPGKTGVAKPRLPQIARNIKSPLGSSPILDVEVTGGEPTKVDWLKDGQVLKETPNMHIEFEDLPDGTRKLHINNMKPEDEGVYTLQASNDAGTVESGPITLSVERRQSKAAAPDVDMASEEFAPQIVNLTEEVIAGTGSEPQLEVDIRASPKAEVTWFKDGKPILERQLSTGHIEISEQKSPYASNVTKHVLKVDKFKPTDAAIYHVVAKNPLGVTESKPISLKLDRSLSSNDAPQVRLMEAGPDSAGLTEFGPQILSHPEEVVAAVGSNPTLEVVVKSKPAPETTWFKDGQPLTKAELSSGHYEVVREAGPDADTTKESLVIKDLKPADVAAYHVKAENPLGEVESEPSNLRIDRSMAPNDAPIVTKTESPFSAEEAADSAKRRLVAPSINRMPRKVVAALGSNPIIEVEVSGEPKPEIVWFKDGHQITDALGHIAQVEMPTNTHKLCITNLKAVDQGDYTIKAVNEVGEVQSAPIALVVDTTMSPRDQPHVVDSEAPEEVESTEAKLPAGSFAPKIIRVSDKVTASLGETACIEVEVKALPAAGITWFNDGSPIPSRLIEEGHVVLSETKTGTDTTKYTLELTSLKPSDAGTYQLEAENPLGTVKSPAVGVTLKEKTPTKTDRRPSRPLRAPKIKRVPRQVVAAVGTSPVLEVEVSGEPIPEIIWFRNGKRIEKTDAHFSFEELPDKNLYRMVVNDVQLSDEATYTVQATNEAGTDGSGPIELKVEGKKPASRRGSKQPRGSISKAGFAPQVVNITEEVVAGVGSSPELEITIKASPKAKVDWFKDGQSLSVEDKKKVEISEVKIDSETTKYVLKIKDLKPIDVAAYHLNAENQYGSLESTPINVRIDRSMNSDEAPISSKVDIPFQPEEAAAPTKKRLRPPVIKRMPRKIVAALGSNPVIEIVVSGEPKPEVIWYKNGKRVTEVSNRIEIVEAGPDGTYKLQFYDLKFTDQAEYTIVAKNEAGTVESSPISLIVDKTMSKHDEPFVQDETDLPVDTTMTADGRPTEAPVILRLEDQEALPGQTVKLEAQVLGVPKPDIKWLKDGDEVELNIINTVPNSDVHSLTLKNVNDLYDGVYSIEASNIAGTARKEARVKVVDELTPKPGRVEDVFKPTISEESPKRKEPEERQEKPFIKKGLKFSQVNQGRSIKFEVQIDGKYDELIWMKDGEQIYVPFQHDDAMETDDNLSESIGLAHDDDASTLVGSDDEGDLITTGDDLVSGKPKRRFPPRIIMRPRNIVAGPGSRISLEVRFEGEPKPEVIWFKDGEKINQTSDGKIIIEEIGDDFSRLIIEDLRESDVGSYQVLVENPFGNEKSPEVSVELDNDMVASDDLANTLEIGPSSSVSDGPLKKGQAPRILSRPKSVHAPKGSRITFEVQVSGEPVPIVNWFRDGRLFTQTSDGHVTIEEYSNGCVRLVLSDITDSDVGQYHVVAENKLGSERTIPVTLTIDETSGAKSQDFVSDFEEISNVDDEAERRRRGGRPPRILLRPKSVSARPGSEVTLEVNVVGHSKDSSITWYKNGKQITTTSDEHITIEKVNESYQKLVIKNVKESDSGDYTVSATNDFGLAMSEPVKMTISNEVVEETTTTTTTTTTETFYERFVSDGLDGDEPSDKKRRAPRFTIRPRNKKAPVGSKVEFEVCVKGEPKPDIVWYKNGRRIHLQPDGRVRVEEFSDGGSKLIIDDLEEIDHGVYAAEAKNEWGVARTGDVQLRVTERTEISEKTQLSQRGTARVTTKTKKTRSHYTFCEERNGYVTLTLTDAQMEHDGDYKLIVRNKWGEASTSAPLVVIPKVEPRSVFSADRSGTGYEDSSQDGRDSRSRRTPFDELEDYGHELDKSVGIFGSESRYQSGDDTYLLQLRDTEFPLRLRKYLRFGARQSPSLRSNLMDAHWGAGARVTIRERRKFREVMDEEIDDEKRGLDLRPTPMRLQKEVGTCGYAAAQLEHLRVEAAERVLRKSADPESRSPAGAAADQPVDMMPPFFRVKLKDAVIEETLSGQQEAVFFCLAAGQPQPEYTWFRNDIIITDVNRMLIVSRPDGGSELHIRDPRLHDSGCFKCVARNVHGNVTTRARLRVASRPSRPEPPEYASVTCREVFLTWRPPRDYDVNAADVLGYRLEVSQSSIGEQDNWSVLANDIGHEYYVVDNLSPATSYSFRLSARNKFGWSESSYSTYVTTCRDEATAPARLAVPHEMRSRQYTGDICDPHLLRQCEDDKLPELNYEIELNPVKLLTQEKWADNIELQTEISRGRFSIVSKALLNKEQQVVVKGILVESMTSAQTKNEFDILRSLQHEKVVRLQVAYKDNDIFIFVMERLSGIDVLTYLSSFTSYNEDTVSKIITQVMDAIEYLHFRGMCLLELLPDNVVMTNGRSTSLKLVDFSAARFVPRSGARVPINASQNVEYCPPEVIAGHEVSTASDVWCIGVLTYVLLSGFSPFKGESGEDETRENVRLGRYKYDHIYGNCTPEVTRFLINVFKKHSTKRPTIEQLYENKWLLPNEFMIRKRQQAVFKTDKIVAFAEEFHKVKRDYNECPQRLVDIMSP